MPQVDSKDGITIVYDKTGLGPTLILINGAMGYRDNWGDQPLANELSDKFSVVTYDRRGRGESGDTQPYAVIREIEDIEVLIDAAGASAHLYGFSSGAVLALKAAARLGPKVGKLIIHGAPASAGGEQEARAFGEYKRQVAELLEEDQRGDAVALFFADMLPPEVLEQMRGSPEWIKMEKVAHTLNYDNEVMGDGLLATTDARTVLTPTLILDSSGSPPFIKETADTLAEIMPNAERQTVEGEHRPEPHTLASSLAPFLEG